MSRKFTRERDDLSDSFAEDEPGGWLANVFADEDDFDRPSLWRLASWGVGAVSALVIAVLATQSADGGRREQVAAAELVQQSRQLQWIAKDSQNETRRLAAALETLNTDRDRLYARVTVLEQGFDSVTGSIGRQAAIVPQATTSLPRAIDSPGPPAATSVDPVQTAARATANAPPALPMTPVPAIPAPGAAAENPDTPAEPTPAIAPVEAAIMSTPDNPPATDAAGIAVPRTEFGVDLGSASSIEGLRGLWRVAVKANAQLLSPLRPLIAIKERSNGSQLRLVAGPFSDAAAAARACAILSENDRTCETTVFDGQRLSLKAEASAPPPLRPVRKRKPASRAEPERTPQAGPVSSLFSAQ